MAWTAPRTWTDGELVTAAIMNPHIRDNLLAVGPHLIVRKTSDESLASNTTLQNDDQLVMAVSANEVWQVRVFLTWTASTAGDMKTAWTFPGGSLLTVAIGPTATATGGVLVQNAAASPSTALVWAGNGSSTEPICMDMLFVNGGSSGNLQLQWAQNGSDATATIVKTNSTLWAVKLA